MIISCSEQEGMFKKMWVCMYLFFRSDYCSRYHLGSSKTSPSIPSLSAFVYLKPSCSIYHIHNQWFQRVDQNFVKNDAFYLQSLFWLMFHFSNFQISMWQPWWRGERACQLWFSDQFFNTDGMTDKRMLQIISGLSKNDLIHQ